MYKLANIESKDPKGFWRTIKSFTKKQVDNSDISPKSWMDYFKSLFNVKSTNIDSAFLEYVQNSLPILENMAEAGPLDHEISSKELEKSIKKLKNGKSAGPDGIINEMVKFGGSVLHGTLKSLFNRILSEGQYPTAWKYSTITPRYKSLSPHEPTNYRGIAVADIISKVLTSILNERLYDYFVDQNLWTKNQNGFMKKKQTSDNIFVLHSLFQKYVKQKGKKLYLAFIDFSKFFDVLNRDILKYKLIKYGVTGKFYEVIKSYFSNSFYSVKTKDGTTDYFEANNGVKQGCNLSPTLSNIYQNDIHTTFDESCDPLVLNDENINSLSWADDLVIMSGSLSGLQNCLNKLDPYCYKWGLALNVRKTKFMIMSKGTIRNSGSLTFKGDNIEYVTRYKYLGLLISSNGKTTQMIQERCTKAKKAVFQVRSALSTTYNVSRKLSLSIFDKQIFPILSYGSAIWALSNNDTLSVTIDSNQIISKESLTDLFQNITGPTIKFDLLRKTKNTSATIRVADPHQRALLLNSGNSNDSNFSISKCNTKAWQNFEQVHTSFCKYVLGVTKYASNFAVLGELGRQPISSKVTLSQILYWHRLENLSDNSVLWNAFQELNLSRE